MGYRSDIYIKCEEFAFLEINKVIKDVGVIDTVKIDSNGDYYIDIFDIKWYNEFDWVNKIMNTINEIAEHHEEEEGWMFVFIRFGESDTDIEQINNDGGQLDFWVQRTVPIPDDARVISND